MKRSELDKDADFILTSMKERDYEILDLFNILVG